MPKVNTLFNYFTSPKSTPSSNNASPASNKTKDLTPNKSKPETPNKSKKKDHKSQGKENQENKNKKRVLETSDDENDKADDVKKEKESADTPKSKKIKKESSETPKATKRRRIIIPEDNSEDSGDEYNPAEDESIETEDTFSEEVSESEPFTDSEEESPKKKPKLGNNKSAKKNQAKPSNTVKKVSGTNNGQEQPSAKASTTESWPHLKYDFLQPGKIRDIKKRRPDDPDYDPRTIHVPLDFLDKQTPAMRQWWVLKADHFDTVLFFKVGKFYELYHMDAVTGFNELNLNFMRGEFAHSGFPEIAYGRFSASLVEKGYKVARIEQTETPDMMSQRCSKMGKVTKFDKVVKREICQVSTKGTRVYTPQDSDATVPNSTYLLSIVEKYIPNKAVYMFGVCFIDTTLGIFNLAQFEDDRCNSRLLTLLAHYPPAHIIYERGNLSLSTLKLLNNMLPGVLKESLQKETQFWSAGKVLKNIHEEEYFKNESSSTFVWPSGLKPYLNQGDSLGLTPADDKEMAVTALGGCVYLLKEYLLDQQLLSQGRFQSYVPPDFFVENSNETKLAHNMVLDAMTINNLRILGNEGSLIKTLDHCSTAFGKRLLREWICRPSCRKSVITDRQNAVTELLDRPEVVQEVKSKLNNLPDLERLLSKIHALGNAARLKNHPDGRAIFFDDKVYSKKKIADFVSALNGFEELMKIATLFEDFSNNLIRKCTRLDPEGDFPDLKDTLHHFKTAFDHEEAKKEGSIIPKKGVDSEYDEVLSELSCIKKEAEEYLEKQKKYFGTQVKYFGTDRKRYQIEVPDSQTKKAGNGYELTGSRKGFKRYYTAESKELLSRQIAAEDQRSKVLKDINRRIFNKFSDHYDMWSNATYNISILDCLISLSEYARTHDTCIPEVFDDTESKEISISIKEGVHPCIHTDNFIPNDTTIATEGAAALIILTGPNMGGKSTLMRQVGLLAIMAQIGCQVPANECKITLVDRIFTRLGANDDIMAGQSTFLVELSETSTILQHATKYSLVLLDELGRGTSTYDGTAIAASVVEALTKINCRTLFSTHYHSLVEDYKTNKLVTLAHMACMVENEDDDKVSHETVTFLYKLSEGACPKSYGFNAARLAGIPAHITKRAHDIAVKLENEANLRHAFTNLCKIQDPNNVRLLIEGF